MTVGELIKELKKYNPNEKIEVSLDDSAEDYIATMGDISTEDFEVEVKYYKEPISPYDSYVELKFSFYNG